MAFSLEPFKNSFGLFCSSEHVFIGSVRLPDQTPGPGEPEPSIWSSCYFTSGLPAWFDLSHFQTVPRGAFIAALQAAGATRFSAAFEVSASQHEDFLAGIRDLQVQFSLTPLKKAVPYAFARAAQIPSLENQWAMLLSAFRQQDISGGYVFALSNADGGILGLTPELLFQKQGDVVETMALAGTCLAGLNPSETASRSRALMNDPKENYEHALVIDGIRSALDGLGELEVQSTHVRQSGKLLHLETKIKLRRSNASFQTLISRLHPTPALGGSPRENARAWLARYNEHNPRDRFGGPFGLKMKDLEICVVAIRGIEWFTHAGFSQIGAGCGVVNLSSAEKEWQELQNKWESICFSLDLDSIKESASHTNQELAESTLKFIAKKNVRTICVCPGARNSPWISLLSAKPKEFEVLSFFDERAAGFFALGRARAEGRPVVVLTTSGTAVGELLPAMMEAKYSGAGLFVLSADRPKRFRGTGAPQSCEQHGIFGAYASASFDLDRTSDLRSLQRSQLDHSTPTLHLNVCFEEPLPSNEQNRHAGLPVVETKLNVDSNYIKHALENCRWPLLILGELSIAESASLLPALLRWKIPMITEALSHLREESALEPTRIRPHRYIWDEAHASGYPIDLVLRLGSVPTLRFWRDLETHAKASKVPVVSVGALNFSGLPRANHLLQNLGEWLALPDADLPFKNVSFQALDSSHWKQRQQNLFERLEDGLSRFPRSEPGWFRTLSEKIPEGSEIYLGNSLPIREWDLAATSRARNFSFRANRGLNGIDGQLSSFFGGLKNGCENWCILGDLTTLYDSSAPWILSQLDPKLKWHLVIINNSGGRIFERIFKSDAYQNKHQLTFEFWARQWGLTYQRVVSASDLLAAQVIEVVPDEAETQIFWNLWEPQ